MPHLHLVSVSRYTTLCSVCCEVLCSNAMLQWFAHNGRWGSKFTRFTATTLCSYSYSLYHFIGNNRHISKWCESVFEIFASEEQGKRKKKKHRKRRMETNASWIGRKKRVCAPTKRIRSATKQSKRSNHHHNNNNKNCTCNFQPWSWQWLCHFSFYSIRVGFLRRSPLFVSCNNT